MIFNALTYARPEKDCDYNLINLTGENGAYKLVGGSRLDVEGDRLYLSSMSVDDDLLDLIADRVLSGKSRLIVRAASDLNEVGAFDKRYGMSPVMLLHRYGLLERLDAVAGGVYLDKDDADLMAQCGCPLILTPSFDMGKGHGIADAVMCLNRGLKVGLGTEDCSYNSSGDVLREAELLRLVMNSQFHSEDALSDRQIADMLAFCFS